MLRQNRRTTFVSFLTSTDAVLRLHALADSCTDEGITTMNRLITEDERRQLLTHGQACAAGQAIDPLPVVRLFTPDAHATWLLAALDPADGDTAYGLIDLGISIPELGHVKLTKKKSIKGTNKLPVMRDRYFQAVRPLSEYLLLAQENGSIVD